MFQRSSLVGLSAIMLASPSLSKAQESIAVPEPIAIEDPNGSDAQGIALNNAGMVVGSLFTSPTESRAFSWTKAKGVVELPTPDPTSYSVAWGLNDRGDIVGEDNGKAVLWRHTGQLVALGDLGGSSTAVDINDDGTVVGVASAPPDGYAAAFIWTRARGLRQLGTLGGNSSIARSINDRGEVVGNSLVSDDPSGAHAFYWSSRSGMLDVGTFGLETSDAFAITDQGIVLGITDTGLGNDATTFEWSRSGRSVFYTATLGGGPALGKSINGRGIAVGDSFDAAGVRRAALWVRPELAISLAPGRGIMSGASAINDRGQVLGSAYLGSDLNHMTTLLWELDCEQLDRARGQ